MEHTPHLTFEPSAAPPTWKPLSPQEVADILSISKTSAGKLIRSGYLSHPFPGVVADLAQRPYLADTSAPVFVLQQDVAAPTVPGLDPFDRALHGTRERERAMIDAALAAHPGEWRIATGDSPRLPDTAWVDASRGDWNLKPAPEVCYMLVTLATFITGVLRIEPAASHEYLVGQRRRVRRFEATLLGRIATIAGGVADNPLANSKYSSHFYTDDAAEKDLVLAALGNRIRPQAGPGAFRLDPR